ncbi:MAG: hypothetical protein Q4G39_04865 [Brachymonas sp.]|nr:hypothetical protein [Brachymonas sp.]
MSGTVPGKKLHQVWSNNPSGAFAIAFMSALRFHKEKWDWADQASDALWWVVDDAALSHGEALQLVQKHIQLGKPAVALPKGANSLVSLPAGWKRFDVPVRPADVFCWTHGEKKRFVTPAEPSETEKSPNAKAVSEQKPAPAQKESPILSPHPWREGRFKLIQWPSLREYQGDVAITTGIGRLMGMFITYAHAVEVSGINIITLNAILAEAYANGKMKVEPVSLAG